MTINSWFNNNILEFNLTKPKHIFDFKNTNLNIEQKLHMYR